MVEVTVRTEPAVIDYDDIAEAVEIVPDDHADAPWENGDGYEHTAISGRQLQAWKDDRNVDLHEMRGYASGQRSRDEWLLRVSPEQVKKWGVAAYMRANGASKQVAAECAAANLRRTLDLLTKWYSEGWQYWGVTCEFRGHHASLWGVDDYEYADTDVRHEIAEEIVAELEKDGYTVDNKPVEKRYGPNGRWTLDGWKAHLHHNLHLFDWDDEPH